MKEIKIDLNAANNKQLNESYLGWFGDAIKLLMRRIFGEVDIPVQVSGTESQIRSFAKALEGERRYMDSFRRYGLDDPRTYRDRAHLEQAVSGFERATSIKWPFK
jgi:hypothetical protein